MKKATLLVIIIFYISIQANSQNLDSLKLLYPTLRDSSRLAVIKNITIYYLNENDSLNKYAQIGLDESRKINHIDFEGKFLMYLTIGSQNMGEYQEAIAFGKKGILKFNQVENTLWAAGLARQVGQVFIDLLMYDSALIYCQKSLKYHTKLDVNPGTLEAISSIAYIHEQNENPDESTVWNKKMLALSQEHNFPYYEAAAYFNLGNVYDMIQSYDSSLYFKRLALKHTGHFMSNDYLSLIGNIGETFLKKGDLDSALHYISKFYEMSRNNERAIYRKEKKMALSAINLGATYYNMEKYVLSERYILEGIQLANEIEYKEKLIEAYQWMYLLKRSMNDSEQALTYYEKHIELRDIAQSDKNKKNIHFLSVKYQTEKKQKEIELLTSQAKIQNLQIQNNKYMLAGIGGVAALLIISITALYSRKNYKLKAFLAQEKEAQQKMRFKSVIEGEEKERKRIAQDLHDGLGQLLSTARLNVSVLEDENDDEKSTSLNSSLKLIDEAVNEVRNISHNLMPNALISIGFEAAIKEQVHLINDAGKVLVHLSIPDEALKLEESKAISIYRIIQEILNNALKYANSTNIHISIDHNQQSRLQISIKDDGIGFDTKVVENSTGIGWENIISRTDLLNGELNVQSEIGAGSEISLKVAV